MAFSRDPRIPNFQPTGLKSAGMTTSAGSAANAVSVGSLFGELRDNSPDFTENAIVAEKLRRQEQQSIAEATANAFGAKYQGDKTLEVAELQADGIRKQGESQKKAGIMSALGSIASAGIGLLSDETVKHTIDELEYACDMLRELRPVSFYYKEEYSASPERMHYGFIAQEFMKVMPDATYLDDRTGKMCIDTIELISVLVRANQELQSRVTRLEAKASLVSV